VENKEEERRKNRWILSEKLGTVTFMAAEGDLVPRNSKKIAFRKKLKLKLLRFNPFSDSMRNAG